MSTIYYKLVLSNNVEYVFDKMFEKNVYSRWTKPFNEDLKINGVIGLGQEVFIHGDDQNGMIAEVTKYETNKVIEFSYIGNVTDGETIMYRHVQNFERYKFVTLSDNMISIDIELGVPDDYVETFETMWSEALELIMTEFDNEDEE